MEHFPPMPTKRAFTAVVCSGKALVVAGGLGGDMWQTILSTVEVMDTDTLKWSTVSSLPHPLWDASATVCEGRVYLVGGKNRRENSELLEMLAMMGRAQRNEKIDKEDLKRGNDKSTKSVFTCSLGALLQSQTVEALAANNSVWNTINDLPVKGSTCVVLNGQLVAVGGYDSDSHYKDTNSIYAYDTETSCWEVISQMPTPRHWCLVAVLPGNKLMVVGGKTDDRFTDKVEIGRIL